jgi:hypothetical protein
MKNQRWKISCHFPFSLYSIFEIYVKLAVILYQETQEFIFFCINPPYFGFQYCGAASLIYGSSSVMKIYVAPASGKN